MSKFSENLSNLMLDADLDDDDIADECGTTEATVRRWRRGEATPSLDQLIAVSDALDVTVDELLGKVTDGGVLGARVDSAFDDDDSDDEHECYVSEDGHGHHNWKWRKKGGIANVFKLFPFSMVCVIVYLVLGFACGAWHPGWIIFLAVPIYKAITEDPPEEFPWLTLVTMIYLLIGCTTGAWHPWWLLYLTTPIYHFAVGLIRRNSRK